MNTTQYECSLSVLVRVCVAVYLLLRGLPGISMCVRSGECSL